METATETNVELESDTEADISYDVSRKSVLIGYVRRNKSRIGVFVWTKQTPKNLHVRLDSACYHAVYECRFLIVLLFQREIGLVSTKVSKTAKQGVLLTRERVRLACVFCVGLSRLPVIFCL